MSGRSRVLTTRLILLGGIVLSGRSAHALEIARIPDMGSSFAEFESAPSVSANFEPTVGMTGLPAFNVPGPTPAPQPAPEPRPEPLAIPTAGVRSAPARFGAPAAPSATSPNDATLSAAYQNGVVRFDQGAPSGETPEAVAIHPERTAMARSQPSVPARLAKPLLSGSILDYGAGRGADTRYLKAAGLQVQSYDPFYFPNKPSKAKSYDWVMLNYVLNVIRTPAERAGVLRDVAAFLKPGGRLLVAVRGEREIESSRTKDWTREGDGWITPRQTFQHGYAQTELESRLKDAGLKVVQSLSPLIVIAEKIAPEPRGGFGKQTPQAVYFHRSLESRAPARLSALVSRAKRLLPKNARWNLIKVDHHGESVSFLWYPDFDSDPHPALNYVYRVDLKTDSMTVSDHSARANPFILHRKDSMVGSDYPLYAQFRALTVKEESAGLLSRNDIGTRKGWEAVKAAKANRP